MSAAIAATRELTRAPFGVNVFAVTPTERRRRRRWRRSAPGSARAPASRGRTTTASRRRSSGCSPTRSRSSRSPSAARRRRCSSGSAPPAARSGSRSRTSRRRGAAAAAGADALVVQGFEAGGHRAAFVDDVPGDVGLLALLQLVAAAVPDLPLVATGGIATGRAVAAVLAAGAAAAQVGTAFMRCPEAGTPEVHRRGAGAARPDGRDARVHGPQRPRDRQRLHARARGRGAARLPRACTTSRRRCAPAHGSRATPTRCTCGPGQAHELISDVPAAELVRSLHAEAQRRGRRRERAARPGHRLRGCSEGPVARPS